VNDAILQPGDAVGTFKVMEQLGDGRWGPLYKVRNTARDTWHVLRLPRSPSKATRDSLRREVRLQRGLAHPNVVALDEVIEDATLFGVVSEYVEGTSLREVLADEAGMELSEATPLLVQVLDAVCCAHALGLVHEALTPGEVLLSVTSSGVTARVTDFGLARATQAQSPSAEQQRYVAPELAVPGARLDARSDVFSLGCIVYEALAGRPPFDGPVRGGFPPLRTRVPDCPPAMADAVTRALALDPDDRFDNVAGFARALFDAGPEPRAAAPRPTPAPVAAPATLPAVTPPVAPSPPARSPPPAPAAAPPFDDDDSAPPDLAVSLVMRVVQFVIAPVLLVGGLGLGGAWLESGSLRQARASATLAEAGLQGDLLEETAAAVKLRSWGAPAGPLDAALAEATAAATVEARLAATEKLADTVARLLTELPPAATPEQELARREVARMVSANQARVSDYRAAIGDRRAAEARPLTSLVDLLGLGAAGSPR